MVGMQEMGVQLDLGPEGAARCIEEAGITFMFAPRFHPAMKQVMPVRRALQVRTAFNVLGPMLNPAGASYGLVGVYTTKLARLMAGALQVSALSLLKWCTAGVKRVRPVSKQSSLSVFFLFLRPLVFNDVHAQQKLSGRAWQLCRLSA
jgi:anthranilate phosphoribosyltransferase